jgi:hypothetical protein
MAGNGEAVAQRWLRWGVRRGVATQRDRLLHAWLWGKRSGPTAVCAARRNGVMEQLVDGFGDPRDNQDRDLPALRIAPLRPRLALQMTR